MTRFDYRTMLRLIWIVALIGVNGAACPARAAVPPQTPTLLVVGDSISAEYGLARDSGWVQLLRDRLHSQQRDYNVVNASISGDTTSNGLSRLPALLSQYHPRVVIIELGGNDGLRGFAVATTKDNLAQMIALSKTAGAKVLITGIQLPPNYGAQYTSEFAALYGDLAHSTHVALVPFLFQGFAQDSDLFQGDRIHPSAAAQPMLLDNVFGPLQPLL